MLEPMRKLRWFVVFVLALSGSFAYAQNEPEVVDPELAGMSTPRLAHLETFVRAGVENKKLNGAVIGIARLGKTVYLKAFGHRDGSAALPMAPDSLFDISSLSQPIVAAGALVLQERGKWLLSDQIGSHLESFKRQKLTLLSLLRQSGGLPSTVLSPKTSPIAGTRIRHSLIAAVNFTGSGFSDALAGARGWQPKGQRSQPGFSYDVLGLAMEQVSGQTLGAFLLRELFIPLDMWNTGFNTGPEMAPRFVSPPVYATTESADVTGRTPARDLNRSVSFDCGGACLYASANDYLRFARMLLNNGRLNNKRILSRTSVQYMVTDRLGGAIENRHMAPEQLDSTALARTGYGLGVNVHRNASADSLGGSAGEFGLAAPTGPYFWVDPTEKLAVVVMALIPDPIDQLDFHRGVRTLIRQAITD
jgi:CubicO group peptidase (beta-lactamase class C family)